MAEKSPAVQHYWKDFLVDTAHLTAEQVGCYARLLGIAWTGTAGCKQGEIMADPINLARMAGVSLSVWKRIGGEVTALFQPASKGKLRHKRLCKELAKQRKRRKQASTAGKRGARKRWGTLSSRHSQPIDPPIAEDASSSSSSSSSSSATSVQEKRPAKQLATIYTKANDGKALTPFPSAVTEFQAALDRKLDPEKLKTEAAAGKGLRAWEVVKKVVGNGQGKSVNDIVLEP